jgi:hypothetical protein
MENPIVEPLESLFDQVLRAESAIARSGVPMKDIRDLMQTLYKTRVVAYLRPEQLQEYRDTLLCEPVRKQRCKHCGATLPATKKG